CSDRCNGRCYHNSVCCHDECAAGCHGLTDRDCNACAKLNDSGRCVSVCPSFQAYNATAFMWYPDPKGKFAHERNCVAECP
ncbi:hypothetical protein HELRODRAFT_146697, partial [Helobdella robusta]|uniref:Furin-like cysteine-rich domain-containing protein n=1 Tax=Helobdella robusta TaxID=6412 RepID=T1EJT9_HELRO